MFPDLYNPSAPRILLVEAHRTNSDGVVRPSYLVALLTVPMLMEWGGLSGNLPAGMAGCEEATIVGQWGGIDFARERYVEHHLTANGLVKIESSSSSLKTVWFDLDEAGDVFLDTPKCHVVLGSKAFCAGKGKQVVARLKLESVEYARIEEALRVREDVGSVMMFGPILTGCNSSFSF